MDIKEVRFRYKVHQDRISLQEDDNDLLIMASDATESAYAPYSNFRVGAAIKTSTGETITGSNQENGSFPIGQCAERVAIYRLSHELGRKEIKTIAVIVDNVNQDSPTSPCGSCRQIIMEYRSQQDKPIRLLLGLKHKPIVFEFDDITDLLPFAFDGSFLGQ